MQFYSFKNDYSEGCHPRILERLIKTNQEQQPGYGDDAYCVEARSLIRKKINDSAADIHFVSGGTQANLIVISAVLRPHESVIAATTGHIFVHETGAIEATGHKINTVAGLHGKVRPADVQAVLDQHTDLHMVKPRMVYISDSTEVGTIYKKQELEDLSAFCKANKLYLFLDGARLGSALCAEDNDLTLADIARLTDVFYIGGTKNGALLGEAIVITNNALKEEFGYHIKQKGGLMAKGRLMGIQFGELFKDDLYFDLATHANRMSMKIAEAIRAKGFSFLTESTTNQIFPILPNALIDELAKKYLFYVWRNVDEHHSAIRLITSWATEEPAVDQLIDDLRQTAIPKAAQWEVMAK